MAPSASRVVIPSFSSRARVLGPMPGTSPGEALAKRALAWAASSTTKPSGFSASEATFATSLLGPRPTEQVSPVRVRTASLTRAAAARGRS